MLEGGLVQVALQGEVAEGFPGRLVGLHLHGVALHGGVVSDGAASHQRGARQALEILQGNTKSVQWVQSGHFVQRKGVPCFSQKGGCLCGRCETGQENEIFDLIYKTTNQRVCTTANRSNLADLVYNTQS